METASTIVHFNTTQTVQALVQLIKVQTISFPKRGNTIMYHGQSLICLQLSVLDIESLAAFLFSP